MTGLISFQECLDISENTNKNLLLGNGFSIDLFPEIFSAELLKKNKLLSNYFKEYNTSSFEAVLHELEKEPIENINIIQELKLNFIETILNNHPENIYSINETAYSYCYVFLKEFNGNRIFTVNYDLLLYWAYLYFSYNGFERVQFSDGFRPAGKDLVWIDKSYASMSQTLNYLHGSLHIYTNNNRITKQRAKPHEDSLKSEIEQSVRDSRYPIFITEGSTGGKLQQIKTNPYLNCCYEHLKEIAGNLFIYGHSLRDEDDHIFEAINFNSGLKRIFVSQYKEQGSYQIQKKIDFWRFSNPEKEYYIFDAESANVWGKSTPTPT